MAVLDDIREKVKFHIRGINSTDEDIDNIIMQVISDIAQYTSVFKKIVGFTIHADKTLYDFRDLLRINERVEVELQTVTIGDISDEDILDFIMNPVDLPDPNVDKEVFVEEDAQSMLVSVLDIFDDKGYCISDKFDYHGTSIYYANDIDWLKEKDGVNMAFVAQVIPHPNELLPEDVHYIMPSVIEGCKYYFNDTFQSGNDVQVGNFYYRRYYAKTEELRNLFPTKVISRKSFKRIATWL